MARSVGTERRKGYNGYDHRRLPPNALRQRAWGGVTLVSGAALCAWTFCSTFADTGADQLDLAATRGDKLDVAVSRSDKLVVLKPSASAPNVHVSLFDPRYSLDFSPGIFANSTLLQDDGYLRAAASSQPSSLAAARNTPDIPPTQSRGGRVAQTTVLPRPRPASAPQIASDTPAAADRPGFFARVVEKVFGKPASVKLAYAATDEGGLGVGQIAAGSYDQWTAVYDISAHTVYMPDGARLEAHSGFGSLLDDPNHADEKMRGVTPPNIYDLELRAELFHGVRALRLIPQDERKVFGRAGLLAHTFMLGPNGDSNGCVSIRNYDVFLQAYVDHKIKRLAVVTSL
jgi:hypothetical protein